MDEPNTDHNGRALRKTIQVRAAFAQEGLIAERVRIEEGVNALFEIRLDVRTHQPLSPAQIIGRSVDLRIKIEDSGDGKQRSVRSARDDLTGFTGRYRPFNGLICEVEEREWVARGLRRYEFVMRPQIWLLSQRSDYRIWLNQSAIDVLETLLHEHGLSGADLSGLTGNVRRADYSVQYGESDLDYVRRRLEEAGLFWWFVQEEGRHRLRVANYASGWLGPSAAANEDFDVRISAGRTDSRCISSWRRRCHYVTGGHKAADWNFETPGETVAASTPTLIDLPGNARTEHSEYPARVATRQEAEWVGRLRMQANEAGHERVSAQSDVRILEAGRRFRPFDMAHQAGAYEDHVITHIVHELVEANPQTGEGSAHYSNQFKAVPARLPLTPQLTTPRPLIEGSAIAIVAGPAGEEIHTDRYGRVKLCFPWDRRARKDGSDTPWIRVCQIWGGSRWGAQIIPRVGMEVMISYLEGDPDRPVVVGVVNNPHNMPSYPLPANKALMVLRSQSHKGEGGNEIAFDDTLDQENQFFHARKDRTERVRNNLTQRVDEHSVASVGGNSLEEVGQNKRTEIAGASTTVVGETGAAVLQMITDQAELTLQTSLLLKESAKKSGVKQEQIVNYAATMAIQIVGVIQSSLEAARLAITNGPNPQEDAGKALAAATKVLGAAKSLQTPFKGMATSLIAGFKTETVGVSATQQVKGTKVTNVGGACLENVGNYKSITVGEELVIECGKTKIEMHKDGRLRMSGTSLNLEFIGPISIDASVVTVNGQIVPQA